MAVVFHVAGVLHPLTRHTATVLVEELRRTAAGQPGSDGIAGAPALADAIDAALAGESTAPIPLTGEAAEATYRVLDASVIDRFDAPAAALYAAVREQYRAQHGDG